MTAFAGMLAMLRLVSGSAALAQTAPDPQALVSEWAGVATRIAARAGASRDTYSLTIERVEGGKVYGHADALGGARDDVISCGRREDRSARRILAR